MTRFDWPTFLREFSKELLADDSIAAAVGAEVVRSGWMGFPPATKDDLDALENRLGCTLPPSYRLFLATSNGWRCTGREIDRLWSTSEVAWLRDRRPDLAQQWHTGAGDLEISDSDYYVYGDGQDPATMREEYLRECLEVSDWGDSSLLLLNPEVTFPQSGEWEAWWFATWFPGAWRFRSFEDLMQAQRRSFNDSPATGTG